ncbi:MAG: peptide chain release factor-like protein [Waddliaceae bacterium]
MDDKLTKRMEALGIHEDDLIEKFIPGAGSGGQKINKTDSCVYLKHVPTKIEIKCQESRSRVKNRYYARERLVRMIEVIRKEEKEQKKRENHLKRQQRKGRSKASKEKILQDKHHRSKLKKGRKAPKESD